MSFFTPLEGTVLLRSRGSYSEAKLFSRDGKVYAKRGSSFVKLLSHELTSVNKLNWCQIKGISYCEAGGSVEVSYPQITASAAA